jgi:hypothetical protein
MVQNELRSIIVLFSVQCDSYRHFGNGKANECLGGTYGLHVLSCHPEDGGRLYALHGAVLIIVCQ